MFITIIQGKSGQPVVTVAGETGDTPKKLADAYLETQRLLKEEQTK